MHQHRSSQVQSMVDARNTICRQCDLICRQCDLICRQCGLIPPINILSASAQVLVLASARSNQRGEKRAPSDQKQRITSLRAYVFARQASATRRHQTHSSMTKLSRDQRPISFGPNEHVPRRHETSWVVIKVVARAAGIGKAMKCLRDVG